MLWLFLTNLIFNKRNCTLLRSGVYFEFYLPIAKIKININDVKVQFIWYG